LQQETRRLLPHQAELLQAEGAPLSSLRPRVSVIVNCDVRDAGPVRDNAVGALCLVGARARDPVSGAQSRRGLANIREVRGVDLRALVILKLELKHCCNAERGLLRWAQGPAGNGIVRLCS
jgi:hypothetical protein